MRVRHHDREGAGSVRVYAISDTHGQLPPIPQDADLILHAGDIAPDFGEFGQRGIDKHGVAQAEWLDTTFRAWLETAPCPVVSIAGNHDFVFEHIGLVPDLPWTYLQDQETTAAGLRIWGTPWVPGLPFWAFYGSDVALEARASIIPPGLDVLLSHGPPYRAADFIPGGTGKQVSKYGNRDGMHVGDKALRERINEVQPRLTVCGHIHEARGYHYVPKGRGPGCGFTVVNVSAVDAHYVLHEHPWTLLHDLA
jgi:Icc-related predicted phosphoesterase